MDGRREPEEEEAPASIEPGILRIFEDEDSRMHAHASAHLPLSLLSTLDGSTNFKPRLLERRAPAEPASFCSKNRKRRRNEGEEEEEEEEENKNQIGG